MGAAERAPAVDEGKTATLIRDSATTAGWRARFPNVEGEVGSWAEGGAAGSE